MLKFYDKSNDFKISLRLQKPHLKEVIPPKSCNSLFVLKGSPSYTKIWIGELIQFIF